MATLAETLEDCRSHLDEASPSFWSDDELKRWIYEALRDINRTAETLQDVKIVSLAAGQQYVQAPIDMVRIHRIEYRQSADRVIPLEFVPYNDIESRWYTNPTTQADVPAWWSWWGFPSSGQTSQIILFPVPSAAVADALRIFYYRLPRKPVGNDDPLEISAGWEDMIPLYVEYVSRRKDNDSRWKDAKSLYDERKADLARLTSLPSDQETFVAGLDGLMPSWLGAAGDWDY